MSNLYTVKVRAYLLPIRDDREVAIISDEDILHATFEECIQHVQEFKTAQHMYCTGHDFQIIPE